MSAAVPSCAITEVLKPMVSAPNIKYLIAFIVIIVFFDVKLYYYLLIIFY